MYLNVYSSFYNGVWKRQFLYSEKKIWTTVPFNANSYNNAGPSIFGITLFQHTAKFLHNRISSATTNTLRKFASETGCKYPLKTVTSLGRANEKPIKICIKKRISY